MDKVITVLKLLPAIVIGVKALEQAVPGSGKGAEKLAALREILEVADSAVTAVWPTIELVVAAVVKLMNATKSW